MVRLTIGWRAGCPHSYNRPYPSEFSVAMLTLVLTPSRSGSWR